MGANAGRLPQTDRDAVGALSQLAGSLADSLGPGQTGHSCLGVKGSRVQIPAVPTGQRQLTIMELASGRLTERLCLRSGCRSKNPAGRVRGVWPLAGEQQQV